MALRATRVTADEIATCLEMAPRTVSRILARAGLARLRSLDPAEPANRFETPRPGQLVHIDVKKLGRIERIGHPGDRIAGPAQGHGWERVHVAVGGATRLAYVEVLADERKETAAASSSGPSAGSRPRGSWWSGSSPTDESQTPLDGPPIS